ncbi:MAG TPA: hypothetical protein VLT33_28570 [Labilithrix sp.]|nr:hypothetical protein [Labilithrix sp.]
MRTRTGLVTGALVTLVTRVATAQSAPPIDLAWDTEGAEALCPSTDEVLADIERLLGHGSAPRKSLVARARVRRSGPAWRVTISTRTEERAAERAFTAATCKEAAAAAALIMALAVDANAGTGRVDEPPAVEVERAAPAPPPSTARPPETPRLPPAPPPRPSLSAFLGFATGRGMLPETAVGAELGAALALSIARIEVAGAYSAGSDAQLAGQPAKGATFHRLAFTARACAGGALGAVELFACATGGLSRVDGAAFGTTRSLDGSATWGDAGGSGLALWRWTRAIALRLRVGAQVPFQRPPFVITSLSGGPDVTLFRPAAATLDGTLGLEARFF